MVYTKSDKRPLDTLKEKTPRVSLVGAGIVIIALVVFVTVPIKWGSPSTPILTPTDIITPIISVVSATFIALFTYHYQSISQNKRDEILNKVNEVANNQESILLSSVRGQLIGISDKIGRICEDLSECLPDVRDYINIQSPQKDSDPTSDQKNSGASPIIQAPPDQDAPTSAVKRIQDKAKTIKDKVEKIKDESAGIRSFIGELYQEILTVKYYIWKAFPGENDDTNANIKIEDIQNKQQIIDNIKNALHEAYTLKYHIDYFLFDELEPKNFKNVSFSTVLKSGHCNIIIGSERERGKFKSLSIKDPAKEDQEIAKELQEMMPSKHIPWFGGRTNDVRLETDTSIKIDEKLLKNHLLLIGGPRTNYLTRKISKSLPLQYIQIEDYHNRGNLSDNIYSRINEKVFCGSNFASVQVIRNPFAYNKFIVIAFGSNSEGTKIAVKVLIEEIKGNVSEQQLETNIPYNDPADPNKNVGISYPAKVIRILDQKEYERNEHNDPSSYIKIKDEKNVSNAYYCQLIK